MPFSQFEAALIGCGSPHKSSLLPVSARRFKTHTICIDLRRRAGPCLQLPGYHRRGSVRFRRRGAPFAFSPISSVLSQINALGRLDPNPPHHPLARRDAADGDRWARCHARASWHTSLRSRDVSQTCIVSVVGSGLGLSRAHRLRCHGAMVERGRITHRLPSFSPLTAGGRRSTAAQEQRCSSLRCAVSAVLWLSEPSS